VEKSRGGELNLSLVN